ncbi:MAG TPA: ADP-ribosylglycohydrolase family protein [Actinocrinis sp.]|nr:ADP-ribosylglycohydrolase family protein [Actinocrinis sp.]
MNGTAAQAARESLRGLALGDGFGDQWFPRRNPAAAEMIRDRQIPTAAQWRWSDDTAMALSVLQVLEHEDDGRIDQRRLAGLFGTSFVQDTGRKYGPGMRRLLPRPAEHPELWPELTQNLFDGQGSLGNGAAMRVAPLGAWFRDGMTAAAALDPDLSATEAAGILGSGKKLRADDTVPFALWSAARNLGDLAGALWCTAEGSATSTPPARSPAGWPPRAPARPACPTCGGNGASRCRHGPSGPGARARPTYPTTERTHRWTSSPRRTCANRS